MKIYVVDNGGQWTHREMRVLKYLGLETKIVPNDTKLDALMKEGIQGLVLSGGSPRVSLDTNLLQISEYLDKGEVPILGICFGHHYIAKHYGGKVGAAEVPEFGEAEIRIVKRCEILEGIPERFKAWESHNDEVKELPKDFECCASSDNCKVQVMRYNKKPIFGVQYHPEVEHTEYGNVLFQNFINICKK